MRRICSAARIRFRISTRVRDVEYPNFLGAEYVSQSRLAAFQELINFYPEIVEVPGGRNRLAIYPTPGQQNFLMTSDIDGRALFTVAGRTHAVQGSGVYELVAAGSAVLRGTVAQDVNLAQIAYNGTAGNQLAISSGGLLYYLDLVTNLVSPVTGILALQVGMIDGFFCAFDNIQNRIYVSPLNDQTGVWDPTQFIERTTQPDPWQAMVVIPPDIWAIGELTGDVLYDAGSSPFPLAPRPGITFRYGIIAPFSAASIGNSVLWLARDKDGAGVVVQTRGYQPQPISDKSLETAIAGYARDSRIDDAEGWTYLMDGHQFYVLNFPAAGATWAYDTSTQAWSRRATWNPATADYEVWSPRCHTYAFGKHLVSVRASGSINELDNTFGSEADGAAILRTIVPPPLWVNGRDKRLFVNRIDLIVEPGLGLSAGQGSTPTVMMRVSRDTKTWSNQRLASAGRMGYYGQRVFWLLNGSSEMTWQPEFTFSDPVPWRIVGCEIDADGVRGAAGATGAAA